MNKVVLLGTEHPIQLGENAPNEFRAVLMEECERNKVKAIAEEINNCDNSIASELAVDYQIEHLYADPDVKERIERGISNNIPLDIMEEYGNKYPNIRMWPREPSEDNLPAEVWREYSKRTNNAYRLRERIWLEKINCFNKWPLLFICGADHFDEFSKLLISSKFHVIESHKNWLPS